MMPEVLATLSTDCLCDGDLSVWLCVNVKIMGAHGTPSCPLVASTGPQHCQRCKPLAASVMPSLLSSLLAPLLISLLRPAGASTMTKASLAATKGLTVVEGLEPRRLWSHFAAISAIPRASKHEAAVLEHIKTIAAEKGLTWKQDAAGNMVVRSPGRGSGLNAPPVIIQGHVDIVTEKNTDTSHDFLTDPIQLRLSDDGAWLGATGTTLGADNGIGVAAALALLDEPEGTPLPPLELLFTVEEETGLHGARKLDARALGLSARTLLNLDTEEWGALYCGCAGGGDAKLYLPGARLAAAPPGSAVHTLSVRGLLGGHSGINIAEGRCNAVLQAAATARTLVREVHAAGHAAHVVAITGGDKHNAIPREAEVHLCLADGGGGGDAAALAVAGRVVADACAAMAAEYGLLETKASMELAPAAADAALPPPLDVESSVRWLDALLALPHGPLKWSHALSNLVETSSSVAAAHTGEGAGGGAELFVLCSSRSSVATAIERVRLSLRAVAETLGRGRIELSEPYPGWQPDMESKVLGVARDKLRRMLEEAGAANPEPEVLAIHAGLECGLIGERILKPDAAECNGAAEKMDMVSFGPTIRGAHSPDEQVEISTVAPFYALTKAVLAELANASA